MHRIKISQRRSMLGIYSLIDRIPNIKIRRETTIENEGKRITGLRWISGTWLHKIMVGGQRQSPCDGQEER